VDAADSGGEEEEEQLLEAPEIETLVKEELESAKEKGQMLQVLSTTDPGPHSRDAGSGNNDLNPTPCALFSFSNTECYTLCSVFFLEH